MARNIRLLSPDGYDIRVDSNYKTEKEAWKDFDNWKKRYEGQGYYSSNKGRIALDDLHNHMTLIK